MSALKLVMTTTGLGRFTAAQAGDDIDLTIARVGLTNMMFVAAPSLTALPGEFRRLATVSGSVAAENVVHMTVTDDAAISYTVRGFGLFLNDGTLFAAYSQGTTIVEKSVGSMLALAIDIAFPVAGVDQITFGSTNFLNPPASTERKGVVELATIEEGRSADPLRVTTGEVVAAMLREAVPPGTITLWFGDVAPTGWAICNGQTVDRRDGSGPMKTPDLRGRVPVGASDDHAVGAVFGAAVSTLATTEGGAHSHAASTDIAAAPSGITLATTTRNVDAGGSASNVLTSAAVNDPKHVHDGTVSVEEAGSHDHTIEIDLHQPSLALNYIVKF